jgi:hypothetical protein
MSVVKVTGVEVQEWLLTPVVLFRHNVRRIVHEGGGDE